MEKDSKNGQETNEYSRKHLTAVYVLNWDFKAYLKGCIRPIELKEVEA